MRDFYLYLNDELIEEDYDDIQEKKFTRTAQEGFVGISDKYLDYISYSSKR